MRLSFTFLLFCSLVFFSGCGDEFIQDPAMTAKINGSNFTACSNLEGKIPVPTAPKNNLEVTYTPASGQLTIRGTDSCNDSTKSIHLDIKEVRATGTFVINQQSKLYYNLDNTPGSGAGNNGALQYLGRHPANSAGLFSTQPTQTGVFTLTEFDLEKRRLSADFEMEVYDARSAKGFKISEGRLRNVAF